VFAQLYAPQAVLPLIGRDLGLTAGQAGLVVSVGTIGLALGVIPWAGLSGRYGRVNTMRAAILAGTGLTLLSCFATTLPLLLAARFVAGFAIGAVPALALSYLNAEVRHDAAARGAGVFIAGNSIGGLLGRILAGVAAGHWGWQGGMLAVSLLSAAAAVGFVMLVQPDACPDSECDHVRTNVTKGEGRIDSPVVALSGLKRYLALLSDPMQRRIYLIGFLLMGAFVTVYNYLGYRLQAAPFNLPSSVTSFLFVGLLAGTVASVLTGGLVIRHGRKAVIAVSGGVLAVGVAVTLIPQMWAQVCGLVLVTLGFFGGQSVASGWASAGPTAGRTQAGALYTLAYYAGGSLVGWCGGEVLERLGWLGLVIMVAALGVAIAGTATMPLLPARIRSSMVAVARDTQAGHDVDTPRVRTKRQKSLAESPSGTWVKNY
jgi:predicted MFS family arabinose efflux permease